jgi:cytosine/creatinine deaminase
LNAGRRVCNEGAQPKLAHCKYGDAELIEASSLPLVALPSQDGSFAVRLEGNKIAAVERVGDEAASWFAMPAPMNPHAHADRAFSVAASRPLSLRDAVEAASVARQAFTVEDVSRRARLFFERSLEHGTAHVRTHTDVDPVVGLRSIEGVMAARRDVAPRLGVDVIAFSTSRNDLSEATNVARLDEALTLRPDYIGASPNASRDPARAIERLLDLAERRDLPIDLHIDEHLDPTLMLIPLVAEAIIARGLIGRVIFSHACVLSVLEAKDLNRAIDLILRAGATVIALPETNLLLQGRGAGAPRARGITTFRELVAAGVSVRLGTDNVRDWFYPFGDGDLLETALIGAISMHIDDETALIGAICDGRSGLEVGDFADLLIVPSTNFHDAVARRPGRRVLIRRGEIISPSPNA